MKCENSKNISQDGEDGLISSPNFQRQNLLSIPINVLEKMIIFVKMLVIFNEVRRHIQQKQIFIQVLKKSLFFFI